MLENIYMCKNEAKTAAGIAHTREGNTSAYISSDIQSAGIDMKLLEDNWDYIKATAAAKAVEIARHSGRMSDVEDFTQDVLCYLVEHADQYNPKRSQPKTFINMILTYAKKDLLRRMYRMKRRTSIKTVELHQTQAENIIDEDNTIPADIADFISSLQEPIRTISRQVVMQGISAGIVARKQDKSKDEILAMIRRAMRPFAASIGIRAAAVSDEEVTEAADHPADPDPGRGTPTPRVGSSDNPFRR